MRDQTEDWLADNDPTYSASRRTWRHVAEANGYRRPLEEDPSGESNAVLKRGTSTSRLIDTGSILCHICWQPFRPREKKNNLCSPGCRKAARRAYLRAYMRRRRSVRGGTAGADLSVAP